MDVAVWVIFGSWAIVCGAAAVILAALVQACLRYSDEPEDLDASAPDG